VGVPVRKRASRRPETRDGWALPQAVVGIACARPSRCQNFDGIAFATDGKELFDRDVWLADSPSKIYVSSPPALLRADSDVPPQERWLRVYAREFDEVFTSELVQRIRQERTTVHGALSAALCQTVANEIAGEGSVSIKHRSPVNVRAQLVPVWEDWNSKLVTAHSKSKRCISP
jgi:hypothetical protein